MIGDMMKNSNGDVVDNGNSNRLSRWHHNSSRIIRASRDSGGKDRHSKVWTSKGPRDRRVRLSVSTALQFYDLQDRLGYDQPSKAVEWLIKAADESISELPSLNINFPTDDGNLNQTLTKSASAGMENSLTISACSCNSDTSKNSSVLSRPRSEIRDEAKERTNERDDDNNKQTSFTDLLNSGSVPVNQNRQWNAPSSSPSPMEYFSSGLILGSGQTQFPIHSVSHHFSAISDHHRPHPEFSFVPNHLISPAAGAFNLDFNILTSSGVASAVSVGSGGFNRGTLQSNSTNRQSFLTNPQRFPSSEGGGTQFIFGALPAENHHPHPHPHHNYYPQFQLYYENGSNADEKGKGKN